MVNPLFSRKWLITIAFPSDKNMTHAEIKERLSTLDLLYWCMADELSNGVYHTHIFIFGHFPLSYYRLRSLFPNTHMEKVLNSCTCKQARAYVFKEYGMEKKERHTVTYRSTREQWKKKGYTMASLFHM